MSPLAATATSSDTTPVQDAAVLVLILVVVTVGYLGWCYVSPFARCGRCDGNGKLRTRNGRAWRPCPRCDGDGARLRIGRHLVNHLRAARRDADKALKARNRRAGGHR